MPENPQISILFYVKARISTQKQKVTFNLKKKCLKVRTQVHSHSEQIFFHRQLNTLQ